MGDESSDDMIIDDSGVRDSEMETDKETVYAGDRNALEVDADGIVCYKVCD